MTHVSTPVLLPCVQDNMQRYVEMVVQEIEASQRLNSEPLQSVFFGGGGLRLRLLPWLLPLRLGLWAVAVLGGASQLPHAAAV